MDKRETKVEFVKPRLEGNYAAKLAAGQQRRLDQRIAARKNSR